MVLNRLIPEPSCVHCYNKRMDKLKNYNKYLAVLMFLVMILANAVVNIFRLNGTTTGDVSNSYPNLFAPIGLTFAIWGIIYLLLGLYSVRQFGIWRGKQSARTDKLITTLTPLYIATSVINTIWVFAWQYKIIWLSLILIVCLLVVLAKINTILDVDEVERGKNYWLIKLPFSVYFGWVTVATIANVTVWLVSIHWSQWGLSEEFWTITVMTIGALIGVVNALRLRSAAYILVFAWAYLGILLKHISSQYYDSRYPLVILSAVLSLGVFAFTAIFINGALIGRRKQALSGRN